MCLAIPGKIIDIDNSSDETFKSAKVSFDGIIKDVNLMMVPDAKVGNYVIVHVGVALNIINEEEATQTLKYLKDIGNLEKLNSESKTKSADND